MIHSLLIFALAGSVPNIYYAAPLVVVISLVHGATRHENPVEIIKHSLRSFVWVVSFSYCLKEILKHAFACSTSL